MLACWMSSAVSSPNFILQMNPYRSVSGSWSLENLVAVVILGATRVLWKNDPRSCLDRSTVGGRLSCGTIDDSSTLGGGVSSGVSVGVCPGEGSVAAIAVVGYCRADAALSSAGRTGCGGCSPDIAAFPRDSNCPTAAVAPSPYPPASSDLLFTLAARLRALCLPGGSRVAIPSSRALLTSACANSPSAPLAGPTRIDPGSGVRIRVARNIALKLGVLPPSPLRQESSSSSGGSTRLVTDPFGAGRFPQPQILPQPGLLPVSDARRVPVSTDNDGCGTDRTERSELWLGAGDVALC